MSPSNTAAGKIRPRQAESLWTVAGYALALFILRRATRQAHRELVALSDRKLADTGLVRGERASYPEARATVLAQ